MLSSGFHCTQRVRTTGPNNHQTVLKGCPPSPTWCCTAQEAGVVVNRQLAPPSRHSSSTFLELDSDFFLLQETRLGSSGSLRLLTLQVCPFPPTRRSDIFITMKIRREEAINADFSQDVLYNDKVHIINRREIEKDSNFNRALRSLQFWVQLYIICSYSVLENFTLEFNAL